MFKPIVCSLLCCLSILIDLRAQVINDNIENRINLQIDQPFQSRTNGCTVQWDCVDESLTGKCIDYHNDQWFSFNSVSYSKLYINISNQVCRDLRGVQIVVLKGEPCDVGTYQILRCVSLANQDDIYVELDPLDIGQDYLINIDGYLHDFCSFEIEVSQNAKGLSVEKTLDLMTHSSREAHLVRIDWVLPDSLQNQITGFQVFRRIHPELKNAFFEEVPVSANAYGEFQTKYFFEDSIAPNQKYYYKLAAEFADGKLLQIDDYEFYFRFVPKAPRFISSVRIPFGNVKNKDSLTILIYDQMTGKLLDHEVFTYVKKELKYYDYRTGKALIRGVEKLQIKVINNTSKVTNVFTFDLWTE